MFIYGTDTLSCGKLNKGLNVHAFIFAIALRGAQNYDDQVTFVMDHVRQLWRDQHFFLFQLYSQKNKTYLGLQKDCNYYCKKSFTIWLPRGSYIWNKMLMKPTGKMEKSKPPMGSDFSVFPVGFISNLFHIYHSHICSFRGSWLIILKFAKSTLMFNHQFLLRHLQFLILSYTVTSLLENCHLSVKGLYLAILWENYWQLK